MVRDLPSRQLEMPTVTVKHPRPRDLPSRQLEIGDRTATLIL